MLSPSASRRFRARFGARGCTPRDAAGDAASARVKAALARCVETERTVLALMLVERLTPREAARTLGVAERDVLGVYHALMVALRLAARGPVLGGLGGAASRITSPAARTRKA